MGQKEVIEGIIIFKEFRELGMHSPDNLVFTQVSVFLLKGVFYFNSRFYHLWNYI